MPAPGTTVHGPDEIEPQTPSAESTVIWRIFILTAFLSSTLLFLIEPVTAKRLLPLFGGSGAVWVVSMMFFQIVLLLGYGYVWLMVRYVRISQAILIHLLLLLMGLAVFTTTFWIYRPPALGVSGVALLITLLESVGFPFFLLSATTPLLETWRSLLPAPPAAHRLFALSNFAGLAILVLYPLLIEPGIALWRQLVLLAAAYAFFSTAAVVVALAMRHRAIPYVPSNRKHASLSTIWLWICLSATASALWLSIAQHISSDVAPVPLLWIVPLGLYLVSCGLVFSSDRWYRPAAFRRLLPWSALTLFAAFELQRIHTHTWLAIVLYFTALFIGLLFCNGEVARRRPAGVTPAYYYFWISLGGALGGLFVAVVAPMAFNDLYELPVSLIACGALALLLLYQQKWRRVARVIVLAVLAIVVGANYESRTSHTLVKARDFFGVLRVTDSGSVRSLYSGSTLHGNQLHVPAADQVATTYYGPHSGIGRLLKFQDVKHASMRVGVIGLGVGTLALYGRPDDQFDFYELDPEVVAIASSYFSFLRDAHCRMNIYTGDGRLRLAQVAPDPYAIIVVDAFSGDSIPVHLLTREAIALYKSHLTQDGVIAFHITNRYLNLAPEVLATAHVMDMPAAVVDNDPDPEHGVAASRWVLVARNPSSLAELGVDPSTGDAAIAGPVWSDDFTNIFRLLK